MTDLVPRPPDDVLSMLKVEAFRIKWDDHHLAQLRKWLASFGETEYPWPENRTCPLPEEELLSELRLRSLPTTGKDAHFAKILHQWLVSFGQQYEPH